MVRCDTGIVYARVISKLYVLSWTVLSVSDTMEWQTVVTDTIMVQTIWSADGGWEHDTWLSHCTYPMTVKQDIWSAITLHTSVENTFWASASASSRFLNYMFLTDGTVRFRLARICPSIIDVNVRMHIRIPTRERLWLDMSAWSAQLLIVGISNSGFIPRFVVPCCWNKQQWLYSTIRGPMLLADTRNPRPR